jgi:hypothetical protein
MYARFGPRAFYFITICVLMLALGAAVYAAQASADPATSTENAKYRSDRWHFSLAVPADMTFAEYEREGNGQTVQFMDLAHEYKFQVSAWPYSQLDVTLGNEGTPSTVSDQPDHLEIVDVVRDDMFTVLFQKNGVR